MKKKISYLMVLMVLMALILGTNVYAAWIPFNDTTPTLGGKEVATGTRSTNPTLNYAVLQTFDCEEAFRVVFHQVGLHVPMIV